MLGGGIVAALGALLRLGFNAGSQRDHRSTVWSACS